MKFRKPHSTRSTRAHR